MNKATSKRRLLKLANFLDALPRNRFNYSRWVGIEWEGKPDLSCGTTACALGWATTMPFFRRLGLRMSKYKYPMIGRNCESFQVATEIFGIDSDESVYLFSSNKNPSFMINDMDLSDKLFGKFSPDMDATPKEVAKHIKRFVKAKYG